MRDHIDRVKNVCVDNLLILFRWDLIINLQTFICICHICAGTSMLFERTIVFFDRGVL